MSMRRLPVYLLLDCSESMAGPAIEAVEQGVQALVGELRSNPAGPGNGLPQRHHLRPRRQASRAADRVDSVPAPKTLRPHRHQPRRRPAALARLPPPRGRPYHGHHQGRLQTARLPPHRRPADRRLGAGRRDRSPGQQPQDRQHLRHWLRTRRGHRRAPLRHRHRPVHAGHVGGRLQEILRLAVGVGPDGQHAALGDGDKPIEAPPLPPNLEWPPNSPSRADDELGGARARSSSSADAASSASRT